MIFPRFWWTVRRETGKEAARLVRTTSARKPGWRLSLPPRRRAPIRRRKQVQFWRQFDDNTLDQLVSDALTANHDLGIALGNCVDRAGRADHG